MAWKSGAEVDTEVAHHRGALGKAPGTISHCRPQHMFEDVFALSGTMTRHEEGAAVRTGAKPLGQGTGKVVGARVGV